MDRSRSVFSNLCAVMLLVASLGVAGCGGGSGEKVPANANTSQPTATLPTPTVTISANAEAVDPVEGTLTVLGAPIRVLPNTAITGLRAAATIALQDIVVGNRVRVDAGVDASTSDLVATSIVVVPKVVGDPVNLKSAIDSVGATSFKLAGLTVNTDASTNFSVVGPNRIPLGKDRAVFFAQAKPGDVASISGAKRSAATILAQQVSVEVAVEQTPPPVAAPPVAAPPVAAPPVATPPVATPPVAAPPVATPPVATPPLTGNDISIAGRLTAAYNPTTSSIEIAGIPTKLSATTVVTGGRAGTALKPADLVVGDSIRVVGIKTNNQITLSSVTQTVTPLIGLDINGPVEAIDPVAQTITLLGVTVNVDAASMLTDSRDFFVPAALFFSSVTLPTSLHVRGMPLAGSPLSLHATSVMAATEMNYVNELSLTGPVTAVYDPSSNNIGVLGLFFTLAANNVITDTATGSKLTPADIALAKFVRITGELKGGIDLLASAVEILPKPLATIELKATSDSIDETTENINLFGLAQKFTVNVDNKTTITDEKNLPVIKRELFGALPERITMRVVGTAGATGTRAMLATSIQLTAMLPHAEHFSIIGRITAIDTATMMLSIFDIPVQITHATKIVDFSTAKIATPFDLASGIDVQVLGEMTKSAAYAETINVQATPITDVHVHASMTVVDPAARTMTLNVGSTAVAVQSNAATVYRDVNKVPSSAAEFFSGTPIFALVHTRNSTPVPGTSRAVFAGILESNVILTHNDAIEISAAVTSAMDPATQIIKVFGIAAHVAPDTVITSAANVAIPATNLTVGTPVSVSGVLSEGTIHLTTIKVSAATTSVVASGPVDSIKNPARTFSIFGSGITVQTNASTQFLDAKGTAIPDFFATVQPHTLVSVTGTANSTATAPTITAQKVQLLP